MMSRKLRVGVVASIMAVSTIVGIGEAFAWGSFTWSASNVLPGFESRTWTANTGDNIGQTLSTCTDPYNSGRISISVHQNYWYKPDVYVGSNSWSCDNNAAWKAYPNSSGGGGDYHWTLDSTPNGGDPVWMTGTMYYN